MAVRFHILADSTNEDGFLRKAGQARADCVAWDGGDVDDISDGPGGQVKKTQKR